MAEVEVGTTLIFENEQVKVWEFTLAPGEEIAAHTHDRDSFFYPVVRGTDAHSWALAWIDGAWREIDTTPPEWMGDADTSVLRPLSDLWSWLTFGFARWRWGERDDRVTTSVGWLLVPLVAILGWRLYFRRRVSAPPSALARAVTPARGADSEFYLVERRLHALTFARAPGEPLSAWISRIDAAHVPGVSVASLAPLLALHYRYRFDPNGLPSSDRHALAAAARGWLDGVDRGLDGPQIPRRRTFV